MLIFLFSIVITESGNADLEDVTRAGLIDSIVNHGGLYLASVTNMLEADGSSNPLYWNGAASLKIEQTFAGTPRTELTIPYIYPLRVGPRGYETYGFEDVVIDGPGAKFLILASPGKMQFGAEVTEKASKTEAMGFSLISPANREFLELAAGVADLYKKDNSIEDQWTVLEKMATSNSDRARLASSPNLSVGMFSQFVLDYGMTFCAQDNWERYMHLVETIANRYSNRQVNDALDRALSVRERLAAHGLKLSLPANWTDDSPFEDKLNCIRISLVDASQGVIVRTPLVAENVTSDAPIKTPTNEISFVWKSLVGLLFVAVTIGGIYLLRNANASKQK